MTVIDRLVTVLGYKVDPKGLDAARKKLETFRKRADQIGRGMVVAGAALTGIGAAVARPILNFERGMNRLAAVSGATAEQMAALREQAIQLGGSTAFSASQAADAQLQLAQAGFSVGETMVALPHVLNLAAAGELEMGEAAALVTSQLRAYGFEVDQAQRVTDVLALTASSANTTVSQLGPAFRQVAPVAAGLGLSIEDTAAAIGVLRNNGLQAEQAGTAVRNILVRLIAPTSAAASALDELGAEGIGSAREELASLGVDADQIAQQMLGGDLVGAMRALGQAGLDPKRAADIFGVEGLAGGLALARQAAALEELRTKLNDSAGSAERMRLVMEAGLPGAVDSMKSAIETLMLRLGEAGLTDVLGRAAEAVRTIATAIAEAPAPLKRFMVGAIALGPALTGAGLALKVLGSAVEGLAGPFRTMRRMFSGLKIGDFIVRMRLAAMDASAFARRMWQRAIPGLRAFRGHMLRATAATTAFARRMATAGIAALRSFARGLVAAGAAALRFAGRAIVAAITGVVTLATTIWASVVPALTAFAASVWATTVALLANPITLIVVGIAALVAAIVLAIKHWDQIKQVAVGAWSAIAGAFQAGVRWIVGAWEWLRDGVVSIVNKIVGLLRSPVGRILALFNPVTAIIAYWEEIKRAAGAVAQFFSGAFSAGITGAWNAIVGAFKSGWRHIKGFFDKIPGWVLWALAVLNPFIGVPLLIIKHWDKLKGAFAATGAWISRVWGNVTGWITDAWDDSIGGIVEAWNNAIGWIIDSWKKLKGFVGRVLGIDVEVAKPEAPEVTPITQTVRQQVARAPPSFPADMDAAGDRLRTRLGEISTKVGAWWDETAEPAIDKAWALLRAGLGETTAPVRPVWDDTAVPTINTAWAHLKADLGEIVAPVRAWWDDAAAPAVRRAWDRLNADTGEIAARVHAWWDEAAVPVLQAAWGRLRSQLGEISTPVRVWWDDTALPAVRTAWDGVRERLGEITTHVRAQWDAGGPVAAVRAAWQELRSTVVEIVAPVRAWWDETAVPAVSAAWARLRAGLDEIVSPVRAQWDETATPALTAAWQDLRTTLGVMFAPVRARWDEGRPVAAVQAAWQGLRTGLDEIAAPVRAVWDQAAVPVVEAAWQGLQAGLGEIAPAAVAPAGAISAVWQGTVGAVVAAWQSVTGWFRGLWGRIFGPAEAEQEAALARLGAGIRGWLGRVGAWFRETPIARFWSDAIAGARQAVEEFGARLREGGGLFENVRASAAGLTGSVRESLAANAPRMFEAIKSAAAGVAAHIDGPLRERLTAAWDRVRGALAPVGLWDGALQAAAPAFAGVAGIAADSLEPVRRAASGVLDGVPGSAATAFAGATRAGADALSRVRQMATGLFERAQETPQALFAGLLEGASRVFGRIQRAAADFAGGIRASLDAIGQTATARYAALRSGAAGVLGQVRDSAGRVLAPAREAAGRVFGDVGRVAVAQLERVRQGAATLLQDVPDGAPALFSKVEEAAAAPFNRIRRLALGLFAGAAPPDPDAPDTPPIRLGVAPTFDPAALRDLWTRLGDATAMRPFVAGVRRAWDSLTRWLQEPVELPELATDFFGGLREAWGSFVDWMRQPITLSFFRGSWGRLGDTVRRVVGAVDDRWQRLIAGLPAPMQTAATTIRTRLDEIWTGAINGAREQWQSFASSIPEILRAGGAGLKTALENLWSGAVASVRTRWRTFVDGLPEPLQGAGTAAKTKLGEIWQGMLDHAGDRWQQFVDGLPEPVKNALDNIGRQLKAIWDTWLSELPGRLLGAIREGLGEVGRKILGIKLFVPQHAQQSGDGADGKAEDQASSAKTVTTPVEKAETTTPPVTETPADEGREAVDGAQPHTPVQPQPTQPVAPSPAPQPVTVGSVLQIGEEIGEAVVQAVDDSVRWVGQVWGGVASWLGAGRPAVASGDAGETASQPTALHPDTARLFAGFASGPHSVVPELSAPGVTNVSRTNNTRVNVTIENIDASGGDSAEIVQNIEQTLEQALGERYHGMALAADGPVDA